MSHLDTLEDLYVANATLNASQLLLDRARWENPNNALFQLELDRHQTKLNATRKNILELFVCIPATN